LLTWLSENRSDKKYIDELKRKDILDFLNAILLKTSARTRNNYRSDLSSLFQVLKNNELIVENHLKTIKVLNTKPEKHKRYTIEQQQDIFNYLEKEDVILLFYIKFIYYGFMRPLEVSRLRIKDVDIKNKTLQFQSKTKKH
jgi:integrase